MQSVESERKRVKFSLWYVHMGTRTCTYIGIEKVWLGRGWQVTFLPETWNADFVGTLSHNLVFKSTSNFMQSDSIFINKNVSPDLEGQHYSLQAFGKDVQHFI